MTSVEFNGAALTAGPANSTNSVYYDDGLAPGLYSVSAVSQSGGAVADSETSGAGGYRAMILKGGPQLLGVRSRLGTGLPGLTVASGSIITIRGSGFSSGTTLTVNGNAVPARVVSDEEMIATLPKDLSGLVSLTVSNNNGKDAISILVAPQSPRRATER